MPFSSSDRLGAYEILGPLGAGGMGEVYRARDTRLGRVVAIKTLPSAFAADPQRTARLEREAQLLAALDNPHIAGIYGLEDVEGGRVLVLEFVDGESLAQRLARSGRLPVDEALTVARQIIDALEAAHEKGTFGHSGPYRPYAVSPDGQRFLITQPPSGSTPGTSAPVVVVINWAAALQK